LIYDVEVLIFLEKVLNIMNASSEIYTSVGITDPLTEESSQDGSVFDDADLMGSANADIVAAQLASAGLADIVSSQLISVREFNSFRNRIWKIGRFITMLLQIWCLQLHLSATNGFEEFACVPCSTTS
jgi:hypothetical protein